MRVELRSKATVNKVDHLEMSLVDFATKVDFSKVLNKLESYTTLESFNKSRIKQESAEQDLKRGMSELVTKSSLRTDLESIKDHVADVNRSNSQKRDCLKDKKETERHVEKMQKELMDLRDDHRNSKERIRSLEVLMNDKVHKIELKEVKDI